ncbi:MAG: dephospho-CoA kinase [Clostridia bacterium]|nr:dephospho-CoA kinase [Clostridia bacterium]
MKAELTERFGDVYVGDTLDRKALGAIVFADRNALSDLNKITHKYVGLEIEARIASHAKAGGTLAAIDAIGLLEGRFAKRTAFNVAITAPTEARVQRLLAREGISEEYARSRIAAQHSNEYFEEKCDYTLHNGGTRAEFEDVCNKFFTEVLKIG